jgi:hypothetical protein
MPANVRADEARTVVTDGDAALVAVPLDETGYCLIPTLDRRAALDAPCVYQVMHPETGDADITETGVRVQGKDRPARWLAYGRITDPRAVKLDLGALTVSLSTGGFFLTEIPEAQWAMLSGTANRGAILDRSGNVLRRGCVNWGSSPGGGSARYSTVLWLDQPSGDCKPQTLPPIPTIDLSRATKLFDVTLTMPFSIWKPGQQITFEKAPASDGTTCVVLVGPGLPTTDHGCSLRIDPPQPGASPIDVGFGTQLAHDHGRPFYAWQITGSTDPSAGIAKLTLSSPTSSTPVRYDDDFFFAQLPTTTPGPRIGNVPFPDEPWVLTGYDAGGHAVAHIDLNELYTRSSPH